MNQFGEVQPIGGVNEKIEGFYAACRLKNLKGPQAVIIPVQNVRHLMLREEVLAAVKAKQFVIYAVSRVEEAVELLMGMPAGKPDKDGVFPGNSVFGKVAARMAVWHQAEKDDEEDDEKGTDSKVIVPLAQKQARATRRR